MEQKNKKGYFSPNAEIVELAEDIVTGSTSLDWDKENWGSGDLDNGDFAG